MSDNLTLEQALQVWRDTEEVKNLKAEYCYLADGIPSLDVNKPRQIDCDQAVGKWHGIVPLITAVDKVAALMVVRYEDHFVRTKAGWKIKSIKSERYFSSPLDQGWAKVRFMAAER